MGSEPSVVMHYGFMLKFIMKIYFIWINFTFTSGEFHLDLQCIKILNLPRIISKVAGTSLRKQLQITSRGLR
ncbi:unnamed protein product [Rhizophagus irregularis]|nr:unnamed protein product [Rhizophagus irregularis]